MELSNHDLLRRIVLSRRMFACLIGVFSLLLLASCDSGSAITIQPQGQECQVRMQSRSDGFTVQR